MKKIQACYAGLGTGVSIHGTGLSYYHCRRWRNATMSPVFVPTGADLMESLPLLEKHFARRRAAYRYDQPAYAVLLGVSLKEARARLPKSALDQGWKVKETPGTLNFWGSRERIGLPRGFHFASGRYFDVKIHRGFLRMMRANFHSTPGLMRELDGMCKLIEPNLRSVLIYHESGAVAGAGLVATKGSGAFLFCGSIAARFRGKGLWRKLVALRQTISSEQGARYWVTSTRVARIMGKGDLSFPLAILTKDAS